MNAYAFIILSLVFVLCKALPEDYETVPYEVEEFAEERPYEKRIYPTLYWVTTRISTEDEGFVKLLQYIQGQNSDTATMNLTTPVVIAWDRTDGAESFTKKGLSFPIPEEFQDNPPTPTNPDLFMQHIPMTLYSWAYEEYFTDLKFQELVAKFEQELVKDKVPYDTRLAFHAVHTNPMESDQKSEVWILAAED